MAEKKLELTTILNKRASNGYWESSPGADYVPGDGELILYKKSGTTPARYKFGDGVTTVANLPFSSDEAVELAVKKNISVETTDTIATVSGAAASYDVTEKASTANTEGNIVAGEDNSAGQRGFTILDFQVNPGGNGDTSFGFFLVSSSADGIEAGDKISVAYHISGGWTHSNSIDCFTVQRVTSNSIFVSDYLTNGALKDGIGYGSDGLMYPSEFIDAVKSTAHSNSRLYRALWVRSRPHIGDRNIGVNSVSTGKQNVASGSSSFSTGKKNSSMGDYSATFNLKTKAIGTASFAAGDTTTAKGDYSFATGGYTIAGGEYSFAGGRETSALAPKSFAYGFRAKVFETAQNGAAFGIDTEVHSTHGFAVGNGAKSRGSQAFASGDFTEAIGTSSFSTGNRTKAHKEQSASFGYRTEAKGKNATSFGDQTIAEGENSATFGYMSTATKKNAFAVGDNAQATGEGAVALNKGKASGNHSLAINNGCIAEGEHSFAAGFTTKAYGNRSATFGVNTETSKYRYGTTDKLSYHAMAIGNGTKAQCDQALAMGDSTEANHNSSVSEGYHTITGAPYQHVFGKYNKVVDGYIVVGDGTSSERKNIFELGQNKMKLSFNYDNGKEGRDHTTKKLDASFTSSGIQITTDVGGYYPFSNSSVNISSDSIEFHSTYEDIGGKNTIGLVIDPEVNSVYVCRDKSSTSKILDVGIADNGSEYVSLPYNTTIGGMTPTVKTSYNGFMVGDGVFAIGACSAAFGYQTLSGISGFSIVGIDGAAVELDSVDGLEIDDEVYVSLFDVAAGGWRPGVTPYKIVAFILGGIRTGVYLDKAITKSDGSLLALPDATIPNSALGGRLSYRLYSKDKPYIGTSSVAGRGVAEGRQTFAAGDASHSEGRDTQSSGDYSHAEGRGTISKGEASHSEGVSTTSGGDASHSEGWGTFAIGIGSHAEGNGSKAYGDYSHSEGAAGNYYMPGQPTKNRETASYKLGSHAEGIATLADGFAAHAEGRGTTANSYAHAEGGETTARGECSHAEGYGTISEGAYAHAEGALTVANGDASHASGFETVADGDNQFVIGKHNVPNTTSSFIVGWGSSKSNRINIHEIDTLGNTYFKKSVVSNGIILCESPSLGVISDSDTSLKVKISPLKNINDNSYGFEIHGVYGSGGTSTLLRMEDSYSLMVGEGAYVIGQTGTATFTNNCCDGIFMDCLGDIYMNGKHFVDKEGNQQLLCWDEF